MSFSDSDFPPSSTELQQTPLATDLPPRQPPDVGLPSRSIVRAPRWPHPNFWWSILWCILFLFVTQIPGAFVAIFIIVVLALLAPQQYPIEVLGNPKQLMVSPAMNIALASAMFVAEALVISFSWLVIRLVVGRDWMRQLALRRPSLAHTLLALASFPALVLLANAAYVLLRNALHVPSLSDYGLHGMEEMVTIFSSWPWAFAVLVIGLGPGIGEELWCRGFLGRGLVGNYGAFVGVVAASFFFGVIHVDPCQGAMAMCMGFWLHFVYLTSRSLWLPMLLHFLNNSFAVLITRVPQLESIENKPSDIPIYVYVTSLFLLSAVAYALYQSRSRLAPQSPQQLILWRPAYDSVEYPPEGSGMRVSHPLPSPWSIGSVLLGLLLFAAAFAAWVIRL